MHDYMMYVDDPDFGRALIPGVRQVLAYFKDFQEADGSVKNLPWWNFTDWVTFKDWKDGMSAKGKDGNSALMDLQLLLGYQVASDLEKTLGMREYAERYQQEADRLQETIQRKYWCEVRGLYADRSEQDNFSQHANTLAILTDMVSGEKAAGIGRKMLNDTTLAPASIYFKYYLHQIWTKVGMGDSYLDWLGKWKENIAMGLTSWAETSEVDVSRSDCHAWGASPNIEFFRVLLGIDSEAPGFAQIKIEPCLGEIGKIAGEMPHPNGLIKVDYEIKRGRMKAILTLPSQTTGHFVWKGKSYELKEGENRWEE